MKRNGLRQTPFDAELKNIAQPLERNAYSCIVGCWFTLALLFLIFMIVQIVFPPLYITKLTLHFNYRTIVTK